MGAWKLSALLPLAAALLLGEPRGERLYTTYGCYECHGRAGQGAPATGPRLGPNPIPFNAFLRYIRRPAGQMPPYTSKVVSDQELAEIYAFLQSLPPPAHSGRAPF